MTKHDVLALLQRREGEYLSGEELARGLSLSRTAVWKAIGQLRAEGYPIESVTRRGYRLLPGGDVLTAEGVREHLRHRELRVEVVQSVSSTNTVLKARAEQGEDSGSVLIALEQTAGRGRMGRGVLRRRSGAARRVGFLPLRHAQVPHKAVGGSGRTFRRHLQARDGGGAVRRPGPALARDKDGDGGNNSARSAVTSVLLGVQASGSRQGCLGTPRRDGEGFVQVDLSGKCSNM